MTLYRQLVLFIAALLFVIFCGIFLITTDNTRHFLSEQMAANTKSTAHSLGISLSIPFKKNDKEFMLSVINSVLQGGAYRQIQLLDAEGKVTLDRSTEQDMKDVPQWFVSMFPLSASSSQAVVKSPEGKVSLTSFTGHVYDGFWLSTNLLLWKLFALYCIVLLLSMYLLKIILRPLATLRMQAEALTKHHTGDKEKAVNELTSVSNVIDNMNSKAQKKFEEEMSLAEKLHKQAYQDAVTGLGNRRYFDTQLQHLISEKVVLGALFLIELQGLKQYNDNEGYQKGDLLIKQIGKVIQENCQDIKANYLSRIGGSTFAILTPYLSDEEISHLATCLVHAIESLLGLTPETQVISAHIGISSLHGIKNNAEGLSLADTALQAAQKQGTYAYARNEEQNAVTGTMTNRNAHEWKQYIEQIIAEKLVTVAYQPLVSFPNKTIIGNEALLRVKGADKLTEARFIIPMADRYGLTYALDTCVIQQVLDRAKSSTPDVPYMINLSSSMLTHEPSLQWLFKALSTGEYRDKLVFELGEHTVMSNLSLVKVVLQQFNEYGVALAIEHFGHDFSGMDYLVGLPLLYIKIDGSYIRDLANQDTQFYISFLTKMSHTLDIKVIAECLETEEQWDVLNTYNLDGAQGRYIAAPQ